MFTYSHKGLLLSEFPRHKYQSYRCQRIGLQVYWCQSTAREVHAIPYNDAHLSPQYLSVEWLSLSQFSILINQSQIPDAKYIHVCKDHNSFLFSNSLFNFISKNRMSISKHIFIFKNCLFSLSWRISRQLNILLIINVNNVNLRVSIFCWKSSYFRKFISYLIKVHATLKKKWISILSNSVRKGKHFFPYKPLHS